jgi:AcrR family transcriptional regulator
MYAENLRKMISKLPNKNELRTKETRELLLRAAGTIFVRDGYEGAELGEIASLAGCTKGAIYCHFKSKEDLFIALFAERTSCTRTVRSPAYRIGEHGAEPENISGVRVLRRHT